MNDVSFILYGRYINTSSPMFHLLRSSSLTPKAEVCIIGEYQNHPKALLKQIFFPDLSPFLSS